MQELNIETPVLPKTKQKQENMRDEDEVTELNCEQLRSTHTQTHTFKQPVVMDSVSCPRRLTKLGYQWKHEEN